MERTKNTDKSSLTLCVLCLGKIGLQIQHFVLTQGEVELAEDIASWCGSKS